MKIRSFSFALISSIGLLILVATPFIFSQKYQSWFLQHGVRGYTFSVLIAVIICLIFAIVTKKLNSKVVVIFATLIFCGSHFVNRQSQENILLDNTRWVNVEAIYRTKILQKFLTTSEEVYAPVLWDHSWWMGFHRDVEEKYWREYTKYFFKEIRFVNNPSQSNPITVFDYKNDSILLSYISNRERNEVYKIIAFHPINIQIYLYVNNAVEHGESNCDQGYCETSFSGTYRNSVSMITHNNIFSLRFF